MTWSYSRITSFETCPYKFFTTYLVPSAKQPLFFSDYGSFVHEILELYFTGIMRAEELPSYYMEHFSEKVQGRAPSFKVFSSYFHQGLEYLRHVALPQEKILAVEKKLDFHIGDYAFTGIIDLLLESEDGALVIWDNKSRALKPRSTHGKYTKTDQELDSYLRQLYLYAAAVEQAIGKLPSELVFNCYRTGVLIREPFRYDAYLAAQQWASDTIRTICDTQKWLPSVEYFFCRHLCDVHEECDYYQLQ